MYILEIQLAVTPVAAVIGSHYKRLAYWGYDLLKPVKKNKYIKERGIMLLKHLFLYWIVFLSLFCNFAAHYLSAGICKNNK